MQIKVLKSKIHRAIVTDAIVDYPGSIAIDSALMEVAKIAPYEFVLVADATNGARLETYVVPEPAGSGKITILGAAAKLIHKGDMVIIMGFAYLAPDEAKDFKPRIVVADNKNGIRKIV